MTGGVDLVIEKKLRPLGERGVKDARIRLGQEQSGRIAIGIARDLAAGGFGVSLV